jgi:GntR family transcriptional regulator
MRAISSRVLAPVEAARALPVCRRSWKCRPGPGGTYARSAELGYKPVHLREEIRSRMPSQAEASRLQLSTGTPVIMICRTAFADEGRPVEVNEMVLDAAYVLEYDFDA